MKRTAYFCAFLLALCLCACGDMSDAKVTSSPAPTMTILPEVMPAPAEEGNPDIPPAKNDDNGTMTNGNLPFASPMPDDTLSSAKSDAEVSPSPAPTDSAAK